MHLLGGVIPVIISDFKVAPLDVLMLPGMTTPINARVLQAIFQNPSAFEGVTGAAPKHTDHLFMESDSGLQFSPEGSIGGGDGSKRSSRPAVKVASVLDMIENVDADAVKETFSYLKDNPEVLERFKENNTEHVLMKLAEKVSFSPKRIKSAALKDMDIDRQLVYKDVRGNF